MIRSIFNINPSVHLSLFVIFIKLVLYTGEATAAGIEIRCANFFDCSLGLKWLTPVAASERCKVQGFGNTCRMSVNRDYRAVDEVECPDPWRPMLLSANQTGAAAGSVSTTQSLLLALPSCYYLADAEKIASWDSAYRECMNMSGTLFYATNDLDVAWLADKLASLPAQSRHVPLNMHRFLYNSKGWAWAPPPPQVGGLGHRIIWAQDEKSLQWLPGEPNGGVPLKPEYCAEYQTVLGNSNSGGLNDFECGELKATSRLLCRRPPTHLKSLVVSIFPILTILTGIQTTEPTNFNSRYTHKDGTFFDFNTQNNKILFILLTFAFAITIIVCTCGNVFFTRFYVKQTFKSRSARPSDENFRTSQMPAPISIYEPVQVANEHELADYSQLYASPPETQFLSVPPVSHSVTNDRQFENVYDSGSLSLTYDSVAGKSPAYG